MTRIRTLVLCAGAALALALPAAAGPLPHEIALPTGFQPEGIATGPGHTFYVGSIPTGAIVRGDLRTGVVEPLVPAQGRRAIGVDYDRGRLFVAGGPTGQGYVYDAETGATLAVYQLTTATPTFINDVIATKDAAWFTDSNNHVLYRVPLGPGGAPGDPGDVETVPLGGEFQPAGGFNVNGIDATPNGKTLVVVQSNLGRLYTVDAETGVAELIDLGGGSVPNGDGILLDGRTLYVVQNRLNQIAVIELSPDLSSGTIVGYITDPELDIPTTIDEFGNRLYAVNARFGVANPAGASFSVVQLRKR